MRHCLYRYRYVSGGFQELEASLQARVGTLERRPLEVKHAPEAEAADLSFGAATRTDRLKIPLRWESPTAEGPHVTFAGTLELKQVTDHFAGLAVVGAYSFDAGPGRTPGLAAKMRRAAEATSEELLGLLASDLGGEPVESGAPAPDVAVRGPASLRVRDVMSESPLVLVEDMPVRTAALLLVHYRIAGAPVVDDDDELVGVLSETDLLAKEAAPRGGLIRGRRAAARRREARTVGGACSRPARTVEPDTMLSEAARRSLDHDVARLTVVDGDGTLVGILSRHDVLKALARSDTELAAGVETLRATRPGTEEVEARVEWGEVTLFGRMARRSAAQDLEVAIGNIDGVIAVDNQIEWDEDDVGRLPLGYPDSA